MSRRNLLAALAAAWVVGSAGCRATEGCASCVSRSLGSPGCASCEGRPAAAVPPPVETAAR